MKNAFTQQSDTIAQYPLSFQEQQTWYPSHTSTHLYAQDMNLCQNYRH